MDIEFDFKGDPVGGVITKCKDWEAFCVCLQIQETDRVLLSI